ncbi:IucA/IucC family protein [Streptomyces chromofuscus]|uniref:IucA/IucC family siderophore biosynthesis protein n=1 Tax=Streptomyces chromofuscus TaxID=42881 RepID=A0A7M2T582_STRCW|nr:IucA/IucC family protein [Streptomyces chromofuscus]QOV43816.1 IucA/IucC family siderophore biosynthesis protein [Streptomyces chromofuscus]GGT21655.1 iron transporter [Streptomyces chromofuscus]
MERVDLIPPPAGSDAAALVDVADLADAHAAAPLLNCLLREVALPLPGREGVYRLPGGDRLLRVRGTRRPTAPEVYTPHGWRRLGHAELVKLVTEELRRHTGLSNHELPAEMLDSRDAVAAILAARARATPPDDPYLRSEQSLVTGHPHHPAPKARGGGPVAGWLPYAPEAHARFPLVLLGLREDTVVEEGDTSALDGLGTPPPGYRLLPAHPWQLDLAAHDLAPALADGRLVRLGTTASPVWPTAAIRTVYAPDRDLFLKFSLDVRITNDVRRLWRHDLLKLRRTDAAVGRAFAGGPAAWLSDRGYRTADFAFEELAVLVRDGLGGAVLPGATPFLTAGLVEGFAGSPLDGPVDPVRWWEAYLRQVVPPVLSAFADHGVVLEAHLQNSLVACDGEGAPVQALFRDAEGVKLLPDVSRAAGWERLVYCLVVNHLAELAGALAERHPGLDPWPAVRAELVRHDLPEVAALLTAPTLPAKTNLLLRWTGADGAAARYRPLPNPLARD